MRLPEIRLRRPKAPSVLATAPGEKVLAWCEDDGGRVVAGTREAFYVTDQDGTRRVPWEQVERADWDGDTETLRVVEVGAWGRPQRSHELVLAEPGFLLELVRERVTASVVLQRHVAVRGRRGLRVVARRAPAGRSEIFWVYEFDEGVDPDQPEVRAAAEELLARMQDEVGLG